MPATGTPEPDGLAPHEPILILQELTENFPITGADMVEVAPFISHNTSHLIILLAIYIFIIVADY